MERQIFVDQRCKVRYGNYVGVFTFQSSSSMEKAIINTGEGMVFILDFIEENSAGIIAIGTRLERLKVVKADFVVTEGCIVPASYYRISKVSGFFCIWVSKDKIRHNTVCVIAFLPLG